VFEVTAHKLTLYCFVLLGLVTSARTSQANTDSCATASARLLSSNWPDRTAFEQGEIAALITLYRSGPSEIPESIFEGLLFDEVRPWLRSRIRAMLETIPAQRVEKLKTALIEMGIGQDEATRRVTEALEVPSPRSWLRAFGELSLEESQARVATSIQRYMTETGARARLHRFPILGANDQLGPERWVVPVSVQSFEAFQKLFFPIEHFFHVHAQRQGTLMVGQRGLGGSYAQLSSALRVPSAGAVWPMMVLSSVEAGRLQNYFDLGSRSVVARHPWVLKDYCATGGYESCTHWFGNIPIGEKISDAYAFPGFVDQHANRRIWQNPEIDALPRVQQLKNFETPADMDRDTAILTRRVWTVPGQQALHEILGLTQAQIRGELANPGWVLHSLVGPAKADRVPVVFVFVNDITQELPGVIPLNSSPY
jgi:hypothetical protein